MIEALLLSVNEPQLGNCLESMNSQTVSFSNIHHIKNVVPQSVAYNSGILLLKDDWFLLTGGDACLYPDAVEKCIKALETPDNDKVVYHRFNLYDAFFDANWGGISIFRRDVYQSIPIMDRLKNDGKLGTKLDGMGWISKKHERTLGVHFDQPDEFQVFRRFYVAGLKYTGRAVSQIYDRMSYLFKKTDNPLYLIAIKAIWVGGKKRMYPGSHNIDFEKKMYEEFILNRDIPSILPAGRFDAIQTPCTS